MLELVTLRCLRDNYAYLIHGDGQTALIDAPEAGPVLEALAARGWQLDHILLTHHHDDHIQAVTELVAASGAQVWGNGSDAARLPPLDHPLTTGETVSLCGEPAQVIDVSGHTIGHIAIHFPQSALAFTGDSLMAIGCGRLFEGDAPMMWASLGRLNALPPETLICSGHDYCQSNGAFALSVDPDNAALRDRLGALDRQPCAPVPLSLERATNPFLRAPALRQAGESDLDAFTRLRRAKDNF